jgi:hypothetical protein
LTIAHRFARFVAGSDWIVCAAPSDFGVGKVIWAGAEIAALFVVQRPPMARKTKASGDDL